MNTAGNPMQVITGKLDAIIQKLDGMNTGDSDTNDSKDIAQIKKDINAISTSMTTLASSVETEEVRNEKQSAMVSAIVEGVNGNIGTLQDSMNNFNKKVKETKFTASLPKEQAQSMHDLAEVLSPDSQTKFGGDLKQYAGQLHKVASQVSKENLQKSLDDASKEWVKNYKETLKKEVEKAYDEVEKKRKQEGKVIVMQTSTFYILFVVVVYSICFGFWGMVSTIDFEIVMWVLIGMLAAGLFIGSLWSWMKFKEWKDDRKWRL